MLGTGLLSSELTIQTFFLHLNIEVFFYAFNACFDI